MTQADIKFRELLKKLQATHDNELDCRTCDEQLEAVTDMVAAGRDLKEMLPLVAAHLECCYDCHEEFDALIAVLRAEINGEIPLEED